MAANNFIYMPCNFLSYSLSALSGTMSKEHENIARQFGLKCHAEFMDICLGRNLPCV